MNKKKESCCFFIPGQKDNLHSATIVEPPGGVNVVADCGSPKHKKISMEFPISPSRHRHRLGGHGNNNPSLVTRLGEKAKTRPRGSWLKWSLTWWSGAEKVWGSQTRWFCLSDRVSGASRGHVCHWGVSQSSTVNLLRSANKRREEIKSRTTFI